MKKLGKWFLQGLIAIVPIALTIYIIYWLGHSAELLLGNLIKLLIPERYYIPGLGIIAGFAVVVAIGILIQAWFVRIILEWAQRTLERIPFVKSIYGSISDLVSFFDASKKKQFNKVVMVNMPDEKTRLIGLVTRTDFSSVPAGIGDDSTVAVYLPMSYQMGGFTVMVPKSSTEGVDMTVEEAMRFALTAAMSTSKKNKLNH